MRDRLLPWFTSLRRWLQGSQAGLSALAPWGYRFLWILLIFAAPGVPPGWAEMILKTPGNPTLPASLHFTQTPPPGMSRTGLPGAVAAADPGAQCRRAVQQAGHAAGLPEHLMSAIARVESGRRGADGQIQPWPWSINVAGVDHVFETKEQAMAAVRQFQAEGVRSIDVGCMQINLMHHPDAFASLDQAFDPAANAAYAAHFLLQLFAQSGSWAKATADYHSATPELGAPYQQKVMSVLPQEMVADAQQAVPTVFALHGGMVRPPVTMSGQSPPARMIPMPTATPSGAASAQVVGRGLDAYRAAPVRIASRFLH
jgi:hypothetical protein